MLLKIELIRYIREYRRVLFSFAAGAFIFIVLLAGVNVLTERGSLFEPFVIGVVDNDGAPELMFVFDYFNENIADLEYMEYAEARRKLLAGEIPAFIELPENFAADIFTGANSPFTVHVNDRLPLQAGVVRLLASGGIAFLSVSQAGIYAALDEAAAQGLSWEEINNSILLPVNFAFEENNGKLLFYFHSAPEGRKIELIKQNNKCGFVLYNDLGIKVVKAGEQATNYYESVMGTGIIDEITDPKEKRKAAGKLLNKYGYAGEIQIDAKVLERTYLAKIEVQSISGKANREEIK
jgi:nitroimidazol reductase NimA-like FMN-containing flavoprotein (pyridoxamine 5'-phosphate oxidase superfamily)